MNEPLKIYTEDLPRPGRCHERGCAWPAWLDAYCRQHWNLRFGRHDDRPKASQMRNLDSSNWLGGKR